MPRLLNQRGGITESFLFCPHDETFAVKTSEDVEPLLKHNAEKRAATPEHWRGDLHHVASIPVTVIEQWRKELGDDPLATRNRNWFVAKLNSSDFAGLRTKAGRL